MNDVIRQLLAFVTVPVEHARKRRAYRKMARIADDEFGRWLMKQKGIDPDNPKTAMRYAIARQPMAGRASPSPEAAVATVERNMMLSGELERKARRRHFSMIGTSEGRVACPWCDDSRHIANVTKYEDELPRFVCTVCDKGWGGGKVLQEASQ